MPPRPDETHFGYAEFCGFKRELADATLEALNECAVERRIRDVTLYHSGGNLGVEFVRMKGIAPLVQLAPLVVYVRRREVDVCVHARALSVAGLHAPAVANCAMDAARREIAKNYALSTGDYKFARSNHAPATPMTTQRTLHGGRVCGEPAKKNSRVA